MNGPQHYREAERLLAMADERVSHEWAHQSGEQKADIIAAAQVHATLALAAATAYPAVKDYHGDERGRVSGAWAEATS